MNTYYLIVTEATARDKGTQNVSNLSFRGRAYGDETEVHVAQTLGDARREMDMLKDKTQSSMIHDRYNPNSALIVEIQTDKPIRELEDELKIDSFREGYPKTAVAHLPNNIKVNVVNTHTHKPKFVEPETPLPREPARTKNFLAKIKDNVKDVLQTRPSIK